MKRIMLIFIAALMLTGCSSKKNSDTEPPVENDDKTVEDTIIEYDASEFRRIDMPLKFESGSTTVGFDFLDLYELGIEERSPNSIPEEEIDRAFSVFSDEWVTDAVNREVESATKGVIWNVNIIGEKLFFSVDHTFELPFIAYGDGTEHDTVVDYEIYCYDMASKELEMLYSYKGKEPPFELSDYFAGENGDIYYQNDDRQNIYKIDKDTGETSVVFTSEKEIAYLTGEHVTGKPMAAVYDKDAGDYCGAYLIEDGGRFVDSETLEGYRTEPTDGIEDRLDLVTDKIRLHTGFSSFNVVSITDSRITLSWESGKLFTFDFDKMELYVTEGRGLQGIAADKKGNFYCKGGQDNSLRLFVPELGTAFRIYDDSVIGYSPVLYKGVPLFVVMSRDYSGIEKLAFIKEAE